LIVENCELFFYGKSLLGQENILNDLKELARRDRLEHDIHFMGESEEIWDILKRADVLLVPSTRPEPFGKVVLEGFSSGTLVIASNMGGPAEIIVDRENGLLHEIGNFVSLAEKIEYAIENKGQFKSMLEAAQLKSEQISRDNGPSQYIEIWEKNFMSKK
jgi:glycosyltransferase involved in cell wall biosynthesis